MPAPPPGEFAHPSPNRMRLGNVKIAGTGRASVRISDRGESSFIPLNSAEVGEQTFHLGRRVPIPACPGLLDPRPEGPGRLLDLVRLQVRLPELLVGGDLILGMIGDQREQPVPALLDIPLAKALDGQPIAEECVGRIIGEALFQLQPTRRLRGHRAASPLHHPRPSNFEDAIQPTRPLHMLSSVADRHRQDQHHRHVPMGSALIERSSTSVHIRCHGAISERCRASPIVTRACNRPRSADQMALVR